MLKRLVVLAGVVCAVLATTASGPSGAQRGYGDRQSAYKHAATLRNPGNDANDVAEIRRRSGSMAPRPRFRPARFAPPSSNSRASLKDADVGLFFYAGHGLQMSEKNYLVSENTMTTEQKIIRAKVDGRAVARK